MSLQPTSSSSAAALASSSYNAPSLQNLETGSANGISHPCTENILNPLEQQRIIQVFFEHVGGERLIEIQRSFEKHASILVNETVTKKALELAAIRNLPLSAIEVLKYQNTPNTDFLPTALHTAIHHHNRFFVKTLLNRLPLKEQLSFLADLLQKAMINGDQRIIREIIKYGNELDSSFLPLVFATALVNKKPALREKDFFRVSVECYLQAQALLTVQKLKIFENSEGELSSQPSKILRSGVLIDEITEQFSDLGVYLPSEFYDSFVDEELDNFYHFVLVPLAAHTLSLLIKYGYEDEVFAALKISDYDALQLENGELWTGLVMALSLILDKNALQRFLHKYIDPSGPIPFTALSRVLKNQNFECAKKLLTALYGEDLLKPLSTFFQDLLKNERFDLAARLLMIDDEVGCKILHTYFSTVLGEPIADLEDGKKLAEELLSTNNGRAIFQRIYHSLMQSFVSHIQLHPIGNLLNLNHKFSISYLEKILFGPNCQFQKNMLFTTALYANKHLLLHSLANAIYKAASSRVSARVAKFGFCYRDFAVDLIPLILAKEESSKDLGLTNYVTHLFNNPRLKTELQKLQHFLSLPDLEESAKKMYKAALYRNPSKLDHVLKSIGSYQKQLETLNKLEQAMQAHPNLFHQTLCIHISLHIKSNKDSAPATPED